MSLKRVASQRGAWEAQVSVSQSVDMEKKYSLLSALTDTTLEAANYMHSQLQLQL